MVKISKVIFMVLCEHQDLYYDTQPGEQPACRSFKRLKYFKKHKDLNWEPSRCPFRGKETDCKFFELLSE